MPITKKVVKNPTEKKVVKVAPGEVILEPKPKRVSKKKIQKTEETKETLRTYEVKETLTRSPLSEGRSSQMGFGFLKNLGDGKFETASPVSPCKDYMNDVVWSEHVGKPIAAYGLSYNKKGIFDKKMSYMMMYICPNKGSEYNSYQDDVAKLKKNFKNLEKIINFFDDALSCTPTKIIEVEENKYLVKFDYKWSETVVAISLFTLLLRACQYYDGKTPPMEFLSSNKIFQEDNYLIIGTLPKLQKFMEAKSLPEQDLPKMGGGHSVHNNGIIAFVEKK